MATTREGKETLRVLELYSGIGGMHWALKESGIPFQVVQAMDVNTTANKIYQHNFPSVPVSASSITKLTKSQLEKMRVDVILMSPPCQPFTRVGKKEDSEDPRSQSFLHLMQVLRSVSQKPQFILVENVKGFEVSETRRLLIDMLQDCDYGFQEFLLSPLQFGVPNARLRYYLIARHRPLAFGFQISDKIQEEIPIEAELWLRYRKSPRTSDPQKQSTNLIQCHGSSKHTVTQAMQAVENCVHSIPFDCEKSENSVCKLPFDCEKLHNSRHFPQVVENCVCTSPDDCVKSANFRDSTTDCTTMADAGRNMRHCEEDDPFVCKDGTRLKEYLEHSTQEGYFEKYLLSDKELRMFVVMDVVHPAFRKSACFTKRYGHYVEGAGSVLQMTDDVKAVQEASEFKSKAVEKKSRQNWGEKELSIMRKLRLRYFTPREVANLLCFPLEFQFPGEFSKIQCYRVLGNSLNVHVVSILIRLMV